MYCSMTVLIALYCSCWLQVRAWASRHRPGEGGRTTGALASGTASWTLYCYCAVGRCCTAAALLDVAVLLPVWTALYCCCTTAPWDSSVLLHGCTALYCCTAEQMYGSVLLHCCPVTQLCTAAPLHSSVLLYCFAASGAGHGREPNHAAVRRRRCARCWGQSCRRAAFVRVRRHAQL